MGTYVEAPQQSDFFPNANDALSNAGSSKREQIAGETIRELQVADAALAKGQSATESQPGAHAVGGNEETGGMGDQTNSTDGTAEISQSMRVETGACYDTNPGMTEAVPVTEREHLQEATPLLPPDQTSAHDTRLSLMSTWKRDLCLALAAGVACAVVLLVLSLAIKQEPKSDGDTTSPPPENSFAKGLKGLPNCTVAALQDPTSPQSMAYYWLMSNPLLESYPEWQKLQRFSLATFFFSTGGNANGWDLQENWLDTAIPECNWFFRSIVGSSQEIGAFGDQVTNYEVEYADSVCDEEGHYRYLVFPKNNLIGTIPYELSLLGSSLEVLSISENKLEGPLPTEIGLLTNLRRLYLEVNSFTGSIPTELGSVSQLEELDLGYNPFSGSIPTELGNLGDSLKVLSIRRSGVTGTLPSQLYLLSNLEILFILGNEGITGAALTPDIANMKKLQRFSVCQVPYASTIPSELGLLTDLWEVNFWNTQISGSIPSELWQLTNVQYLDLASNLLSGTLPAELSRFTDLKQIYLDSNQFTGRIPGDTLQHLGKVTLLKVTDNLISGNIPSQVGFLTSMERMMLNYNHITGIIPTQVAQLSNLGEILLHDTSLSGSLPKELTYMSALNLLVVANTSLTGSIPNSLCSRVVDYEYGCYWHRGLFEICWDKLKPVNFTCQHSKLCGCHCGACS